MAKSQIGQVQSRTARVYHCILAIIFNTIQKRFLIVDIGS